MSMCRAPRPSDLATVCCWSSGDVLVRSKCIRFWPAFFSWLERNRIRNPVSSLGRSAMPSSWRSSIISQPRTLAQKRARRSESFASKQIAKSSDVILISDPLAHGRKRGTSLAVGKTTLRRSRTATQRE
jgi:hypothetical protein